MKPLLVLLLVTACADTTAPEPCEPAVVVTGAFEDGTPVQSGMGCIRVVHWYDEAAP
jgi:hypothetical protein